MEEDESLEFDEEEDDFEEEDSSEIAEPIVAHKRSSRKEPEVVEDDDESKEEELEADDVDADAEDAFVYEEEEEDLPESVEPKGKSNVCQHCHKPQDHFDYNPKKRGWAKCPSCGKYSRIGDIPEKYIREVKSVPKPSKPTERESQRTLDDDDDEGTSPDEGEDDESPFRQPKLPHKILEEVLRENGVKEKATKRIVARCERAGEMHPTEVGQMLSDLDGGISAKAIRYLVEDYEFALQKEEDKNRDLDYARSSYGSYGTRRSTSSDPYSPSRSRTSSSVGEPFESIPRRRDGMITPEEVLRMMEQRDRENERRRTEREKEDLIREMRDTMKSMKEELEDIRENPPVSVDDDVLTKADLQEMQNSTMSKMLEDQLRETREELKRQREDAKEERQRFIEDQRREREEFSRKIEKTQDELRNESRRADSKPTGDGYQDDSIRLLAEGTDRVAKIIESRPGVFESLGKLIPQLQGVNQGQQAPGLTQRPVNTGEPTVADLLSEEFVVR